MVADFTRKIWAAIAAVSVLTGGSGAALAQATEGSAAVRAQVEAYRSAWNTHDPAAVTAFFTEDADIVMGNLPAIRGRQAIQDWWRGYFASLEPGRRATFVLNSLRLPAPDVALINIAATTGGRDTQGEELPERKARGTWVLRRQSGDWLISAMRGMPTEEDRVVLTPSLEAAKALRPQIRAFVEAYEDAFNSHDPSAVSAFYGNDADIVVRNGPRTHGAPAIREWWRTYFSAPRPYRAILIIDEIRMMAPDVALLNVIGSGAALEAKDQLAPVRQARATWVLVREDGEWLIAALRVLPSEEDRIIRQAGR